MATFIEKLRKFHKKYILIEGLSAVKEYELTSLPPFEINIKNLNDFLNHSNFKEKDSIVVDSDSIYTIKDRITKEIIKEDIDKNQLNNFINDL